MESLDAGLSGSPEKINKRRIHQTNDVITYRLIPEERAYIYLAHGEITENSMSRVPCLQKHAPPSSRASPKFSRIHNAIGHQAMQHIWLEYCQLMTGAFCCVQWLGPRIQRYISWIRNRWPVCTVSDAGANPVVVWDAMHITCTSSESSETHNSIIYIHINDMHYVIIGILTSACVTLRLKHQHEGNAASSETKPCAVKRSHSARLLHRSFLALVATWDPSMAKTKANQCGNAASSRRPEPSAVAPDDSPASSVRSTVVGTYDLNSVSTHWDNNPEIRDRIRKNQNLCMRMNEQTKEIECGYVEPVTENLKVNRCVLLPVTAVMKENSFQLPSIDALLAAVDRFYDICKMSRSQQQCYQEAWAIRRLLVRLKKFLYRSHPPQDCSVVQNLNIQIQTLHDSKILPMHVG